MIHDVTDREDTTAGSKTMEWAAPRNHCSDDTPGPDHARSGPPDLSLKLGGRRGLADQAGE